MEPLEINPSELSARLESAIGAFTIVGNYRHGSTRTGVWKVRAMQDGQEYFLKTYSRIQRWHTEVYAYRNWVPILQPYAPKLVETFRGEGWQAILVTPVEGSIMREAGLNPEDLHAAYMKAGQLTRRLHEGAAGDWFGRPDADGNPIELYSHRDPVVYVLHSLEEISGACMDADLLDPHEIGLSRWSIEHAGVFRGSRPVPVSWDSTPGNWLVDDRGHFSGMIDFENMLWGIDADQFSILIERYFDGNEPAQRAFFEGYGLDAFQQKKELVRICCIKLGLADILYGSQHNAPKLSEYGKKLLKRLYEDHLYPSL